MHLDVSRDDILQRFASIKTNGLNYIQDGAHLTSNKFELIPLIAACSQYIEVTATVPLDMSNVQAALIDVCSNYVNVPSSLFNRIQLYPDIILPRMIDRIGDYRWALRLINTWHNEDDFPKTEIAAGWLENVTRLNEEILRSFSDFSVSLTASHVVLGL